MLTDIIVFCVYLEGEIPHCVIETKVNVYGITVRAGTSSIGLVGPFFFKGTVKGPCYLDMLETKVFPIVSEFPILVIFIFNKMEHLSTMPKMFNSG